MAKKVLTLDGLPLEKFQVADMKDAIETALDYLESNNVYGAKVALRNAVASYEGRMDAEVIREGRKGAKGR